MNSFFKFSLVIIFLMHSHLSYGGKNSDNIPFGARIAIVKAQRLMANKKFGKAAKILENFLSNNKDKNYMICFTLGNCYLMAKQKKKAINQYEASVKAMPIFSPAWRNLAKACYDVNLHEKAGHAFLKAYETAKKKKAETLYFAAACMMTAGKNKKAASLFEKLIKNHPGQMRLEWKETLVQVYFALNKPRKALPLIEELSEKTKGPKRLQWQEIRLQQYIALNMDNKAFSYVKRLIREYPAQPKWWQGLAHFHLKKNRFKKALIALTVKSFIEPLTSREASIAADISMSLGIFGNAVELYEKMINKKFSQNITQKIARGYLSLQKPLKALKWVEKGLKAKKNPKLILLKGDILYQMESYKKAATAFEKAARKKASPERAWRMAGYAALQAGEPERAKKNFKRAEALKKHKKNAANQGRPF